MMAEEVKCWRCGEVYDAANRLLVVRHEQAFCLTNRPRKKRKDAKATDLAHSKGSEARG